jgi:hypothetical protein
MNVPRPAGFLRAFDQWLDSLGHSAFGERASGTAPSIDDPNAPIVVGGHIHATQAGFGLSVPDDWIAFNLWHPGLPAALDEFDDESRSMVEDQRTSTALLAGDLAAWRDVIYVDRLPADLLTLSDVAAMEKESDEESFADIRRERIILPSGEAQRSFPSQDPEGSTLPTLPRLSALDG